MKSVSFQNDILFIDDEQLQLQYRILDAFLVGNNAVVLLDPDAYLADPNFTKEKRRGANTVRNLIAYAEDKRKVWEAELPENVDYYYEISSRNPLKAYSFSSFKCEIDPDTGKIKSKTFFK